MQGLRIMRERGQPVLLKTENTGDVLWGSY